MQEKKLLDINFVCKILNTTSRTLRFYEEKGIISSTKIDFSKRRHYSQEQVDHIRKVIVLRKLGLSINSICDLQKNNSDMRTAINMRKAEIYSLIEEKYKELMLLNDALETIDAGEDIYNHKINNEEMDAIRVDIVKRCSQAYVDNNIELLYEHFIPKMREYMSISSFKNVREEALEFIGKFVSFDKIENDSQYPHVYYHYIKFEKIGIKIKFVFTNDKISGFWVNYCNI